MGNIRNMGNGFTGSLGRQVAQPGLVEVLAEVALLRRIPEAVVSGSDVVLLDPACDPAGVDRFAS